MSLIFVGILAAFLFDRPVPQDIVVCDLGPNGSFVMKGAVRKDTTASISDIDVKPVSGVKDAKDDEE